MRFVDADGDGSQASSLANRYLHGPEVDQVFADEQFDAAGQLTNVLWPLADNLGTVRDLANNTGVIVNHRVFDAYGRITGETDASIDHAFAYTGREWDADAQLYYYRARWYDANVGRFISEDPIGFAAGDVNLARYVGNSPTNATDPSGLEEEAWHHRLVKGWLYKNGFIDSHGNTTEKVTGGTLNVHAKENGVILNPEDHNRRPDGVHCKDSEGGTDGMTYEKHFAREMESRTKDGKISVDDLKAAGQATVDKYPKQMGNAPASKTDYPNKKPLGPRQRRGSANTPVVGGLGIIASQLVVQQMQNEALDAYCSGDDTRAGYNSGRMLDASYSEQDYHKRVVLGQDPEVEALPWWKRTLRKMTASMTMCYDGGLTMH